MARFTITDMGALFTNGAGQAYGIGPGGPVVGNTQAPNGGRPWHGFAYATIDASPYIGALCQMVDLGTLGGPSSHAEALNGLGHVVGYSDNAAGQSRAFFWSVDSVALTRGRGGPTLRDLGTLGGPTSFALAINDSDRAAGQADTADGAFHAALFTPGGVHDLGTLGGQNSAAAAINAAGWVVGQAQTADGSIHAFLWRGQGPLIDLGTLGGPGSVANWINTSGDVVGQADTAAGVGHAVVWRNGTITDLQTLGGPSSQALGINDAEQIVGDSQGADGHPRAFLYDGALRDLNTLIPPDSGWFLSTARAINNAGRISGFGRLNNIQRAFLLIPS